MNSIEPSQLKLTRLVNSRKSSLKILNFGATIFSFKMRSRDSKHLELVVGPQEVEDFLKSEYYDANQCFGASIGRYAGRIANGSFSLGEDEFELYQKDGVHLHGGKQGFQYKIWEIEEVTEGPDPSVKLSYFSEHLEEGYPGNLKVMVSFTLTENDEIKVNYSATTDRETVVNLTNHVYWNLNGGGSVSDHFLQIDSAKILQLDDKNLPTGNLENLKDHPKSFMENRLIGNRKLDDVFVIDNSRENAASLFAPLSGVKMNMHSDQPVLVVYVPEKLPQEWNYKSPVDSKFPAIALEAQNYPDAPNYRNFPSSELRPGETYQNEIVFSFSLR
ncbi:galactose mutarotase [Gramella sp. GC03-9]|uniref:Aldose 1-epimerase n=1 Tax=Christiangramia oceanisediminis TaxID=2920386 RepID=A0A9X2RCL9_9FLAO|nr:aldose epimerase family protein [Gramella oceanisediminis]MCP9200965.1 galactose mutarotase [Gramella oceanisediminis]